VGLAIDGAPGLATVLVFGGLLTLMILMRARHGLLATLWDVLRAFLATGIGVWRSLRGDRFQTWSPPTSARSAAFAMSAGRHAPHLNESAD
jgi:hypothetical protein